MHINANNVFQSKKRDLRQICSDSECSESSQEVKSEQQSVLNLVSFSGTSLMEEDAECLKNKLFSGGIFFVTMKLFKVDRKHPRIFL